MNASLGVMAGAVQKRLDQLRKDRVVERIWARDAGLWPGDAGEIRNRLGWLTVLDTMAPEIDDLRTFANEVAGDGLRTTVVLGMGGSSLAPAVLAHGAPREVLVLDSTHPQAVLDLRERIDINRTLFVVSSKSGTTLETLSLLAYFWEQTRHTGDQFAAITDAGSYLDELARGRGFRRVFRNPGDIGGRFSALSYFGLVPAALADVDLGRLVEAAKDMFEQCKESNVEANPGALLGAILAAATLAGRDKLGIRAGDELAGFGGWVEQLIAESTGKEGKGLLPVVDERWDGAAVALPDQLFVDVGWDGPVREPGFSIDAGAADLGAEFARWEFATAVAGHIIGIQPYIQPDVQAAKDATERVLAFPGVSKTELTLQRASDTLSSGGYVALLAYLPEEPATTEAVEALRAGLTNRYGVVATAAYGPRYLHSTGQFHKGGPDGGVYVIIEGDIEIDVAIPGKPYSFGQLIAAQAEGDVSSLLSRGRVVARATMDEVEDLLND